MYVVIYYNEIVDVAEDEKTAKRLASTYTNDAYARPLTIEDVRKLLLNQNQDEEYD